MSAPRAGLGVETGIAVGEPPGRTERRHHARVEKDVILSDFVAAENVETAVHYRDGERINRIPGPVQEIGPKPSVQEIGRPVPTVQRVVTIATEQRVIAL